MHYYTFRIGDYRRDTAHLSLLEHGIYRQLIDTYYLSEKPLCADLATLMRTHCIRTPDEEQSLKNVLHDFFDLREDGYYHTGCDRLIDQYKEKSEKARASATVRWSKDADSMRTHTERNADAMLTNNQEPITNNQEEHSNTEVLPSGGIPTCPHQEIVALFHQILPELPEVRIWNQARQGFLKARWREMALQEKWKTKEEGLAWFDTFFNWLRHSKFLMGKVEPRNGGRAFECELEWILRPTNWAKIIEGKYHAT